MNKAARKGKCSNICRRTFMKMGIMRKHLRPTLIIFMFPLTRLCFTGMGRSEFFLLTSPIGYPLNLIVYSKTCLNRPLKKRQKIVLFFKADYCIMQVKSIAECSQGAFCNTFNLHLVPICLNDISCV